MNPIFLFETPIYGLPKNQIDFNNSFCAQAALAFTFCLQLQKVNKKSRRFRQNAKKTTHCLKSVKLAALKQH